MATLLTRAHWIPAVLLTAFACGRTADQDDSAAGGTLAGGGQQQGGKVTTENGGKPAGGSASGGAPTFGGHANGGHTSGGSTIAGSHNAGGVTSGGSQNGGSTSGGVENGGVSGGFPEAGAGGAGGALVPLTESSWNTQVQFVITSTQGAPNVSCPSTQFTMHVTPRGPSLDAVLGRDGAVSTGTFSAIGSPPSYSIPLGTQQATSIPTRGLCSIGSVNVVGMNLQGYDTDADGDADTIGGSGEAMTQYVVGDLGFTIRLTFTFNGRPDTEKPSLQGATAAHPLDGISVVASEPLSTTSTASLTLGNSTIPLTGSATLGAIGAFSSAAILPFGSTWSVVAAGTDLGGLPFDAAQFPTWTTLADPGLLSQDGFETQPLGLLTGAVSVVSSVGALKALSGTKSLFLPPGSSATFHLARPSGSSAVTFKAVALSAISGAVPAPFSGSIGVIGGTTHLAPTWSPTAATEATGDSQWPYAASTQNLSIGLPEAGPDVIVRLVSPTCLGLCPPTGPLLIDDLRVE